MRRAAQPLHPSRPLAWLGLTPWAWLFIVLALSLLLRSLLFHFPANQIDFGNFKIWLRVAAERGPAGFYDRPNWSDYPPFNVYYFWLFGHLGKLLGSWSLPLLLKLVPNLLDLGIAVLIFLSLRKRISPQAGLIGAAAYAFNPAAIYDLAVWGQMDSFHTLLMVSALLALLTARWELSAGLLALALLTKPQSVALVPVLAYGVLRYGGWRRTLAAAGVGALVVLLVALPFQEGNPVAFLWSRALGGYDVYQYNSLNAYNLWAVLGFWKKDSDAIFMGLTPQVWGFLAFSLLAVWVVWRLHLSTTRPGRYNAESAIFATFLLSFGLFMLLTRMHERYFFPTLALLALSGLTTPRKWVLYLGLSISGAASLAYVLPLLNERVFIPNGHWTFLLFLPVNMALFGYALASFYHMQETPSPSRAGPKARVGWVRTEPEPATPEARHPEPFALGHPEPFASHSERSEESTLAQDKLREESGLAQGELREESALPQSELREGPPATFPPYPTRPGLRPFPPPILRTASSTEQGTSGPRALAKGRVLGLSIEMVAILALVLFFLVAALWGLGSLNMPTSNWTPRSGQESLYLDTGAPADVRNLFFLVQGPEPVKVEASCGQPGAWQVQANNSSEGNWHSWRQIALSCQTRYVRLAFQDSRAAIGEVALFSGAQQLPLQSVVSESASPGVDALRDEQGLVRTPPTYREGSYFDEIYFVRTAEEHIGLKEPFEWTHPPLGKLVIAGGILYLGDRPVAWRLPGVALAALVIPIVYLLARRMFGTVRAGLIATALITFEFMHFTEARLATAEISLFFWIALTFYFFYRYYQPAAEVAPAGPASGWRMLLPRGRDWDLFLAMVFFGLAFATKWIAAYGLVGILILLLGLKVRERHVTAGEIVALAAGAAAAGLIYLLSYVPYLMAGHDLSDLVELQRSMYRYHSTLTATHPYSSPWWSWPFLLKPLWLANNRVDGDASMVVTLGNPALWLVGPFLIVLTAGLFLKLRDRRLAFIVVPFLTQWLFFVPIGRVLFIYHFFPNVLIMVLAATLWLEILWQRWQWPVWGYLALNAFLFLIFYPVLSGYPVAPTYWNDVRGLLPPPLG